MNICYPRSDVPLMHVIIKAPCVESNLPVARLVYLGPRLARWLALNRLAETLRQRAWMELVR